MFRTNRNFKQTTGREFRRGVGRTTSARSRFRRSRFHGVAILEFALVVPVLLAMLIGILEFGWLIRTNLVIANATREGARAASVGRTGIATRTRITTSASPVSVVSPNGSITLEQSTDNGTNWTAWAADVSTKNGVPTGALIRVRVRSNHRQLTGFFPFLRNRVIEQFTTMRREA